jgi:hypothetical protein
MNLNKLSTAEIFFIKSWTTKTICLRRNTRTHVLHLCHSKALSIMRIGFTSFGYALLRRSS